MLSGRVYRRIKGLRKSFLKSSTNYPFVSGDSLSKICDYIVPSPVDETNLSVEKLSKARSIFINGHDLENFLRLAGGTLEGKVVLSGNSDCNFIKKPDFLGNPRMFLCQNSSISNVNYIKTLPIGLENLRLGKSGFKRFHKGIAEFNYYDRVLVPPMSPTNSSRIEVVRKAKTKTAIYDVYSEYLSTRNYFKKVRQYKFIFACEGNGFDTHRIWEILYQNSFPVVLRTDWSASLNWLNLPILMIDDVENLTSDTLQAFLVKNQGYSSDKTSQLWIPFWSNYINSMTKNEN